MGDNLAPASPLCHALALRCAVLCCARCRCVVIEDSLVGLRAAKAAHMRCLVAYTASTRLQDFYAEGADATVSSLAQVRLADIFQPLHEGRQGLLLRQRGEEHQAPPHPLTRQPRRSYTLRNACAAD
jgi:hypothetical protein